MSFPELETTLRRLYSEGKYQEIIDLIDRRKDEFPDQRLLLTYWQIGMAARLGKRDLAYRLMDELLADDLWISQVLLRGSPSLESLQQEAGFEQRVARFRELQNRERRQLLPLLTLHREGHCAPDAACPLLLGLHAERALSLQSIKFWQAAAENGWLVGVPQSSQALWSGAYVWEDRELAREEIAAHLADLQARYAVDARRILLAGHANGGELAMWLPLSGGIDARGFVAVNPTGVWMHHPDQWLRTVRASRPFGMRGAVLIGENDPHISLPELRRIVEILNQAEVPCKLEIVPQAGHEHHPAFDPALLRAIDFVLS